MIIELNMLLSVAIAAIVFLLGHFLVSKVKFLKDYCIPEPVVGGFIFALLVLILRQADIYITMDITLQNILMIMFFTSVGFAASFRVLKKGGTIALSLFLTMAIMELKLWELVNLAIPLLAILISQVIVLYLYANFVTFKVIGGDFDAAIISAGQCGFGLGSTSNAIAVMNSVSSKYGPSRTAFFVVPLVGSLFIDFFNAGILAFFINIL